MRHNFLIFLFFASTSVLAQEEDAHLPETTATVIISPGTPVRSQTYHGDTATEVTVDVNELLLREFERRSRTGTGSTGNESQEVLPTTPFPEVIRVAPTTIESSWEGPIDTIENFVLTNENHRNALQTPLLAKMTDGTVLYEYKQTAKYLVFLSPGRISAIHLERGEKLSAAPAISDNTLINVQYSKIGRDDDPQQQIIVLVSSNFAEADGTIIITTDKRIYHVIVFSTPDFATEIIHFSYPDSNPPPSIDLFASTTNVAPTTPVKTPKGADKGTDSSFLRRIIPDELKFAYTITNPCDNDERDCSDYQHAQNEKFRPTVIYDDGTYTYFGWVQPPPRLPAFFIRDSEGLLVPASYSAKNTLHIVQQTFNQGILMIDQDTYLIIDNDN